MRPRTIFPIVQWNGSVFPQTSQTCAFPATGVPQASHVPVLITNLTQPPPAKRRSAPVLSELRAFNYILVISSAAPTNATNSPSEPSRVVNSGLSPGGVLLTAPLADFIRHAMKMATAISKTGGKILNANIMWLSNVSAYGSK